MSDQNPVEALIKVEKENQKLLGQILASQEELIHISKAQRNHGRWKMMLESAKLIFWPIVLVLSFFVAMDVIKELATSFMQSANPANLLPDFGGGTPEAGTQAPQNPLGNIDMGKVNELLNLLGQ